MENLGPSTRGQKMLVVCPVLRLSTDNGIYPYLCMLCAMKAFIQNDPKTRKHFQWVQESQFQDLSGFLSLAVLFFFFFGWDVFFAPKTHSPKRGQLSPRQQRRNVRMRWWHGCQWSCIELWDRDFFFRDAFLGTKNFNRWKTSKKKKPSGSVKFSWCFFLFAKFSFLLRIFDFDDFLLMKHLESIPEAFTASRFCRWYIPKWGNAESHGKIGTGWLSLASSGIFLWKVKSVSFLQKLALCGEWGNFHPPWEPCKASFLHSLLRASQYCDRARASTWKVELSRSEKFPEWFESRVAQEDVWKNKAVGLAG